MKLYVGSKRLSSWSLRAYLALAHTRASFETIVILLDQPETKGRIAKVNPAGRVPVLHDGELVIWDSLAICEYAHERFGGLWPADQQARARARSISAEMHSGFAALRRDMPMDLVARKPGVGHTPAALADAARVQAIWREALDRSGGPFLFGAFSIADAMFAPVTTRFRTYGVALASPGLAGARSTPEGSAESIDAQLQAYSDAIAALPAMQAWQRDAELEPQTRA